MTVGRVIEGGWRRGLCGVAAVVLAAGAATAAPQGAAERDVLQQAVNYVFTGRIDPPEPVVIVDRKNCVVVAPDPRFKRYARYYLAHFNLDGARYNKRYSGARTFHDLDVQGDDIILEYLTPDRKTVLQAYRSAQIPLPGEIGPTQKALQIIAETCKAKDPTLPF